MRQQVHHEQPILLVVPSVVVRVAHVVGNQASVFVFRNLEILFVSLQKVIKQEVTINSVLHRVGQLFEDLLLILFIDALIAVMVPSVGHVLLDALLEVLVDGEIIVKLPQ